MDPYYGFDDSVVNEIAPVLGVMLAMMVISMVVSVVFYVLQSLGVYTIAKRRQIRNPWFAWLPIVDMYLWGCISDQYQQVARLKNAKRRVLMLIFAIVDVVISMVVSGAVIGFLVELIELMNQIAVGGISEDAFLESFMAATMGLNGMSSATSVFSIVYMVFRFMTLHDIYASCNPDNKTVFLVLSIFFSFLIPIFLFVSRKRDDGMRRPEPVYYNGWQQPYQPQQTGWQQPQAPQGGWQQPQPPQGGWQVPQGGWQPPVSQVPEQPKEKPQEQPQEPWNTPEPPAEPWQ